MGGGGTGGEVGERLERVEGGEGLGGAGVIFEDVDLTFAGVKDHTYEMGWVSEFRFSSPFVWS